MKISESGGTTKFGTGVTVTLNGDELATAVSAYLFSHNINVSGPRTIMVNGNLCSNAEVYVDPSGFVIHNGKKFSGYRDADKQESEVEDVPLNDISLLYDLLFIYDRLYWNSDVGRKQAQDAINKIHKGKYGDSQGCYVQFVNALERLKNLK